MCQFFHFILGEDEFFVFFGHSACSHLRNVNMFLCFFLSINPLDDPNAAYLYSVSYSLSEKRSREWPLLVIVDWVLTILVYVSNCWCKNGFILSTNIK